MVICNKLIDWLIDISRKIDTKEAFIQFLTDNEDK